MTQHDDERKKRITMWVAVIGVTAVIGALWVLSLPQQLARYANVQPGAIARWTQARNPEPAQKKSFSEVLKEQHDRLEATAPATNANANVPVTNTNTSH